MNKKTSTFTRLFMVAMLCVVAGVATLSCVKKHADPQLDDKIPAKVSNTTYVNDFAKMLNKSKVDSVYQQLMTDTLTALAQTGKAKIYVVTIEDLGGVGAQYFATQVAEKWELDDNSIVILFKPNTSDSAGQVALVPGKALQELLPQGVVDQIVNDKIVFQLKTSGNYNKALFNAIHTIKEKLGLKQ
jgi:hypothetical protein